MLATAQANHVNPAVDGMRGESKGSCLPEVLTEFMLLHLSDKTHT